MSRFFVPFVDPANQEEAYRGMAAFVEGTPLPTDRRIRSITFRHEGEVWRAAVGETMRKLGSSTTEGTLASNEEDRSRSSPDTVIAIYSGGTVPYLIAHDGAGRKRWSMPIWVRDVLEIVTFD